MAFVASRLCRTTKTNLIPGPRVGVVGRAGITHPQVPQMHRQHTGKDLGRPNRLEHPLLNVPAGRLKGVGVRSASERRQACSSELRGPKRVRRPWRRNLAMLPSDGEQRSQRERRFSITCLAYVATGNDPKKALEEGAHHVLPTKGRVWTEP